MYILYTTTKNGKLFFASITEPDTTKHVKCQYKKRGPLSCGNIRSITWSKVVFSCRAPDQYISIRSPMDVNRTMGRSGKPGKRSQIGKKRSKYRTETKHFKNKKSIAHTFMYKSNFPVAVNI